jgi:hypothetical protein
MGRALRELQDNDTQKCRGNPRPARDLRIGSAQLAFVPLVGQPDGVDASAQNGRDRLERRVIVGEQAPAADEASHFACAGIQPSEAFVMLGPRRQTTES